MAPWSVNADTPTRADEETNSRDAERFDKYNIYIGGVGRRWVAYIGGVGRRA